jgi:hypothetical protein
VRVEALAQVLPRRLLVVDQHSAERRKARGVYRGAVVGRERHTLTMAGVCRVSSEALLP